MFTPTRMGVAMSCFEPLASLFGNPVRATRPVLRRHSTVAHIGHLVHPREVSTGPALQQLQNVKNARDLAEAFSQIQPGRVLRSACPNGASESDIRVLRTVLGVQQLVDLRSDIERREDADCLLLKDAEVVNSASRRGFAQWETYRRTSQGPQSDVSAHARTEGEHAPDRDENEEGPSLTVHHLALLERNRYFKSLLTRLPRGAAALTVFWSCISLDRAKKIVLKEVNRGGLPQLYEILLDSASRELCTVLRIITAAAERGETVLFFCKIGKDRTGLVAALVLIACGASEDEIISDYARSDGADGVALGGLEHSKELQGLDIDAFSKAPPEAMATCLHYMKLGYGPNLTDYLDHIGFGPKERARMRAALGNDAPAPPNSSASPTDASGSRHGVQNGATNGAAH